MSTIVVYKTKYGSAKKYAEWISQALNCDMVDVKDTTIDKVCKYDTIIYGGGLYAEVINGVHFITKNMDKLKGKKLVVFSTGITPLNLREYYDKLVVDKNFRTEETRKIKLFNFLGKMVLEELTFVHRTALKSLKKLMSSKENPTEMEKLLVNLCDLNGDFCDESSINDLIDFLKE